MYLAMNITAFYIFQAAITELEFLYNSSQMLNNQYMYA